MATSSKVATDTQKKQSNKDTNSSSDEDDEEDLDLGTSTVPTINKKGPDKDFEMINLDADEEDEEDDATLRSEDRRKKRYRKKKKKKEEINDSSSEDESTKLTKNEEINPSDLTWPLYLWYYIVAVSTGALRVAEYLGEKLAYFFGITSPKYQYVIDEYYRLKEIEREEEEREKREREFVEKKEAERIAQLEGGEKASEILTMPDENADNNTK